jgi:hypothetical protein
VAQSRFFLRCAVTDSASTERWPRGKNLITNAGSHRSLCPASRSNRDGVNGSCPWDIDARAAELTGRRFV